MCSPIRLRRYLRQNTPDHFLKTQLRSAGALLKSGDQCVIDIWYQEVLHLKAVVAVIHAQ
jgi:hypothetical protein